MRGHQHRKYDEQDRAHQDLQNEHAPPCQGVLQPLPDGDPQIHGAFHHDHVRHGYRQNERQHNGQRRPEIVPVLIELDIDQQDRQRCQAYNRTGQKQAEPAAAVLA